MKSAEAVLLENIDKPNTLFIFPTDVAASRWADHLLLLRRQRDTSSGILTGNTLAMEKFIAWDTFKQNSIRSKVQGKKSIPSALRKMFASALIRENARLCAGAESSEGMAAGTENEGPVFTSLIRPQWAQQAVSFAPWLAQTLPQLGLWFRQISGLAITQINEPAVSALSEQLTGDDRDLLNLALHYSQFLKKNNLFEPAWEEPPFDNRGNECFLFFPESLFDFNEYRKLLETSGHVTIIHADMDDPSMRPHEVFYYTNSRSEITEAALYILALHNKYHIPWDSISVSIPDAKHYAPYFLRELENRNIPHINRTGKPLASYPAGQFFRALADCASSDFSFATVTALLLNRHLPWKDSNTIQAIVDFGIANNCISSWIEEADGTETKVNVWDDAFSSPYYGRSSGNVKAHIRRYFDELRRRLHAMCYAASFSEIRKQYFAFRTFFFDMDQVLPETDIVLSRCITELMYLADIEKSYPDLHLENPYAFFTGYLEEITYLAQPSASGVTILPYRTAAPAPFDCHIIIGASQDNLSIVFSPLAFLSGKKREKLGLADDDASQAFIDLHRYNSRMPAVFFCSEQAFSGYTIPYSTLNAASKPQTRYAPDNIIENKAFAPDWYRQENMLYSSLFHYPAKGQPTLTALGEMHKNQKQGFDAWRTRRKYPAADDITLGKNHPLVQLIHRQFCKNEEHAGKYSVSASSLAPYFACPLLWIFERVLRLENTVIKTGLMAKNISGDVYHAILNLFLDDIRKTGRVLAEPVIGGSDKNPLPELPQAYRSLLAQKVTTVFESFPRLPSSSNPEGSETKMSMLTARLLLAEKELFYKKLEELLAVFIAYFAGCRICASESYYAVPYTAYYLSGIVDCILEDNRADKSKAIVVDFKTKYELKISDYIGDEGLSDFQLPLYQRLAQTALRQDVHTSLFFSIIDASPQVLFGIIENIVSGSIIPKKESNRILHMDNNYTTIMNEFDEKAERFAREIADGTFAFHPSHPVLCRECKHSKVCRTTYTICRGKNHGN